MPVFWLITFLFLFPDFISSGFSAKTKGLDEIRQASSGYQAECVSINENHVQLRIWSHKKRGAYRIDQAQKDAIHCVLYSGLAGENGCPEQLPLLAKQEYIEKFKAIEGDFFSKTGPWSALTKSSDADSIVPREGNRKDYKIFTVNVSRNELRKFLREKQVIPSLTQGF